MEDMMATPAHHHYCKTGDGPCSGDGAYCTDDDERCQWAVDAGITPPCPADHGTCTRTLCDLPTVNDDVCWWCRNADAGTYLRG